MDYASTCGAATSTVCSSLANLSLVSEAQLKCPMCQQYFVKPVRLCCGHSFCKLCAEKWLRNCTTCSVCRSPTLNPIRDYQLEQIVTETQQLRDAERPLIFTRAISDQIRQKFRNGRTVREVKALQKESTRASMRRPKNLKFNAQLNQQQNQPNNENLEPTARGSVLYRSFRRIKKIF